MQRVRGDDLELRVIQTRGVLPFTNGARGGHRHRRVGIVDPADVIENREAVRWTMNGNQAVEHRKVRQFTATDLTESPHHKRAESNRITSGPRLRNKAQHVKLERQLQRIDDRLNYVAIDAGEVCVEDLLFLRGERGELRVELCVSVTRNTCRTVGVHDAGAE